MILKEIKITANELNYSNPYIDFVYDGIDYRWYTGETKFTKLFEFGFKAPHARAVRGNERKAVFKEIRKIVEELKNKEVKIIDFAEARNKKEEEKKQKLQLTSVIKTVSNMNKQEVTAFYNALLRNDIQELARITTNAQIINNEIEGIKTLKIKGEKIAVEHNGELIITNLL